MERERYEVIVVGSGAGGATVAEECARRGKSVLVVERGRPQETVGTYRAGVDMYDGNKLTQIPARSREGVVLWRALTAGGSTVVSCGNGVRALQTELAALGIDLSAELAEAETEMGVADLPESLISEGSRALREAAAELGYRFDPMPKFVDVARCRACGLCVEGCAADAKWTSLGSLARAQADGADVRFETCVSRVSVAGGRATGVEGTAPDGPFAAGGDVVVLAAGGLGTPVILVQTGLPAGEGLFVDLLVNVYGLAPAVNQLHEPLMALVDTEFHDAQGFILSPFFQQSRRVRLVEAGRRGFALPARTALGIMVKITDEPAGQVFADGSVSKPVTNCDEARLRAGADVAREILVKAGAAPRSLVVSRAQGAHPGGTAALGTVVDDHLQTEIDNLFVCDASVLPEAPGLPPLVTIVALGKWLGRHLAA